MNLDVMKKKHWKHTIKEETLNEEQVHFLKVLKGKKKVMMMVKPKVSETEKRKEIS